MITGGYAVRLLYQNIFHREDEAYRTDDIDIKVCPVSGTGDIEKMREVR